MTFVRARWFTEADGRPIDLLVIHSAEVDELPDSAEGVANYFATTDRQASTHSVVDVDSRVDCVLDKDVAYGANGANRRGLHLELAGRAAQDDAGWADGYSHRMIVEQAAPWLVEKARLYGIPLDFLKADALLAGRRGVTTHAECEGAWPKYGHTDPGPSFPMGLLLDTARALLAGGSPAPSTDEDEPMQHVAPCPWLPGNLNGTEPYFVVAPGQTDHDFVVASVDGAPFDPPWQDGQSAAWFEDFSFLGLWWRRIKSTTGPVQGTLVYANHVTVACAGGGTYRIAGV